MNSFSWNVLLSSFNLLEIVTTKAEQSGVNESLNWKYFAVEWRYEVHRVQFFWKKFLVGNNVAFDRIFLFQISENGLKFKSKLLCNLKFNFVVIFCQNMQTSLVINSTFFNLNPKNFNSHQIKKRQQTTDNTKSQFRDYLAPRDDYCQWKEIHYSIFHETLTPNSSLNVCCVFSLCVSLLLIQFFLCYNFFALKKRCVQTLLLATKEKIRGDVFFPGTNTSFQTHAWFLGNEFLERNRRLRKISLNES